MKKIMTIVLALALSLGMTTVAFAATGEVEGKNGVVLGISSGSFDIIPGDAGTIINTDGNIVPGTKFRVEIIQVTSTDPITGEHTGTSISRTAFNRTDADVYFKASKGSKYFKNAELKYTESNTRTWAQVELKYPVLTLKEDDIDFKLGTKRGSKNDYYEYTNTLENIFIDTLGEDLTDATINKVGTRLKVNDSGFSDIINIDFEADDEVIYDVKMFNKDEVYLYLSTDADRDIATAFPDTDFDFYTFSQVGTFSSVGTLSLPGNQGDYVYELVTGTPSDVYATFGENEFLVPVNATWNDDEDVLQFRTRNLGKYVISSTELDLTEYENIVPEEEEDLIDEEEENINNIDREEEEEENRIPQTGGNSIANLAVLAGIVAMAAAGSIALKK